jgi:hypothetical protein
LVLAQQTHKCNAIDPISVVAYEGEDAVGNIVKQPSRSLPLASNPARRCVTAAGRSHCPRDGSKIEVDGAYDTPISSRLEQAHCFGEMRSRFRHAGVRLLCPTEEE